MGTMKLDDLVARALQSKQDKHQVVFLKIDDEGNTLQANKKDLKTVTRILDMQQDTMSESMNVSMMLIYEHCDLLKNKEVQQAYGCTEPFDVVEKVFDANITRIGEATENILKMYGLTDDMIDILKN